MIENLKDIIIFFLIATFGIVFIFLFIFMAMTFEFIPGLTVNAELHEILAPYYIEPLAVYGASLLFCAGGLLTYAKHPIFVYMPIYAPLITAIYKIASV